MPTSFAEEIAESHAMDCAEADELLRTIVQENRKPNYAESVFFQQKMNWNDVEIRSQLRRMHSVVRLTAIAGSGADREAALTERKTAAEVFEKESPKLDDQIAKLQAKRDGLERDKRLSAKRCEEQAGAVLQLRELLPSHVASELQAKTRVISDTLLREILDIETRTNELSCCLDPSRYPNEQGYLEALQRSFRNAVVVGKGAAGFIKRALSPQWPVIRSGIETELSELNAKLIPLREQYAAAIAEIDKSRDYYANGWRELD